MPRSRRWSRRTPPRQPRAQPAGRGADEGGQLRKHQPRVLLAPRRFPWTHVDLRCLAVLSGLHLLSLHMFASPFHSCSNGTRRLLPSPSAPPLISSMLLLPLKHAAVLLCPVPTQTLTSHTDLSSGASRRCPRNTTWRPGQPAQGRGGSRGGGGGPRLLPPARARRPVAGARRGCGAAVAGSGGEPMRQRVEAHEPHIQCESTLRHLAMGTDGYGSVSKKILRS